MTIKTIENQLRSDPSVYRTPCYIYSAGRVRDNYSALKSVLGTGLLMSIKANHCLDLIILAGRDVDGFEVASEAELNGLALLKNDYSFINNPSMSADLVRKAVAAKVHITIDHPGQIDLLSPLKKRLRPVCLRLSSAIFQSEDRSASQKVDHFGMDADALEVAIDKLLKENISVNGIHIFRGSNAFVNTAFEIVDKLPNILSFIEARLGYPLKEINLGGGFSPNWRSSSFDFTAYRNALNVLQRYRVVHESGRGLFADAGYFVTTIVAVKKINNQVIAVCDGGMAQNFLLAQTETILRKMIHPTLCAPSSSSLRNQLDMPAKIVGSSCNRDDVIGQLPVGSIIPEAGDKLIFANCGAYNRTYSPTKFLGLPEAQEYLLDS